MVSEAKQVRFCDHYSGRGKGKQNKRLIMRTNVTLQNCPDSMVGNPVMSLNIAG